MVAYVVFFGLLLYAGWKILAATMVLRVHARDADDKIAFLPNPGQPYYNPLVGSVSLVRRRARATRRRWVLVAIYILVVLGGVFPTWGSAFLGFIATWFIAAVVNWGFERE